MPKLSRGCKKDKSSEQDEDLQLGFENRYVRAAGRKRCRSSLKTRELKDIARRVIEDDVKPKEVALEHNVKPNMVRSLVKQVKRQQGSLDSIRLKRELKAKKREEATEFIAGKLQEGHHIWTAKLVQKTLRDEAAIELPLTQVRKVLRENLNMRYRVIKKVEYRGNSERCLVTRMLYAKQMLELLGEGKRIVNIDESWLPGLDFRSKKWRQRGERNTFSTK